MPILLETTELTKQFGERLLFRTPPLRISFEASQMRCLLLFFGYCAVAGAGGSALMGPTRSARRSTQRSTPMAPLLRVRV